MNVKRYRVLISNPHKSDDMMKNEEFEKKKEANDYATLNKDAAELVCVIRAESGESVLTFRSGEKTYEEDT